MSDILPEERGISGVASTSATWLTPKRKAVIMAGATIIILAVVFWRNAKKPVEDIAPAPQNGISQMVQYEEPREPPLPAMPHPKPPPTEREHNSPPPTEREHNPPPRPAVPAPAKPKVHRMMSFATIEGKDPAGHANGVADPSGDTAGTHVTFKPTPIVGAQAGPALDKTLVLMPGLIRCVLDVAVDSQMPGPLMCHLPDPIISDGNVVLMEAGSKIMGSYSNDVKQGQNRIMAVSAVGYTPNGVPVPFGGPVADALGRTGMPGEVDNHYVQRFGAAVMMTFLDGVLGIAQASVSKGGNSYLSLNTGNGASSLAEEVLRSTINIPPTITKNQGDQVFLWILSPIDFSSAYKLVNK